MKFFKRLIALFRSLKNLLRSRAQLQLKITALEQQLIVFKKRNPRPKLSRIDRIVWVWLKRLWRNWKEVLYIVKPDTVVRWHRLGFKLYWRHISQKRTGKGKPMIDDEIIKLIYQLARENANWRAPRIHGELKKLGFAVSERTVSR